MEKYRTTLQRADVDSMAIVGNFAYVGTQPDGGVDWNDAALEIYDLSDSTGAVLVGEFQWSSPYGDDHNFDPGEIVVVDDVAYVLHEGSLALSLINVSNSELPAFLGHYAPSPSDPEFWGLAVADGMAWIGVGNELHGIDVSDPANPVFKSSIPLDGKIGRILIQGTTAYVGCVSLGVTVVDVSDPDNPSIQRTVVVPGATSWIAILGYYIFVPTFGDETAIFSDIIAHIPGDANGDGVVSADDYGSVQANFGNTGDPWISGDATGDGMVSADDYGSVQLHFGDTAGVGGMEAVFELTGLAESNNAYVGALTEESTINNMLTNATTPGRPINITSPETFVAVPVDVDWSSIPNQIAKGTWFYTPVTVTNRGNVAITPGAPGYFMTTLYNSTNNLVAAVEGMEASPIATASMRYLAPGQSYTVYLWAHADEDPDTYNLQVLTNVFDSVLELDEANNWSMLLSGDIV